MVKASLRTRRALRTSAGLAVLTATVIAGYGAASSASSFSAEPPPAAEVAHQVATWGASPLADRTGLQFSNQTFRDIVRTGIGGKNLRIRLSNVYGRSAVTFTDVRVGIQQSGAAVVPGSNRQVTFDGSTAATVYPGTEVYSDPLQGQVSSGLNLVVSIYLPGASGATTNHWRSEQTTYVSMTGDHAADEGATAYPDANSGTVWWYLDEVTVEAAPAAHTVVTYGDSITDGYQSSLNSNHRYPDFLAARLLALPASRRLAVLNEGIAGDRVFTGMLSRLDRDVLAQPDVRTVIYLGGINDIGVDTTAAQLIAADRQIIDRLHARGIRVIGGTLTPFAGSSTYDDAREQTREAVNTWIRTSGAFDGVVDFDRAVHDPDNPMALLPAYDSGDHLHPNDQGYAAMANAVDLEEL